MTNSVLFSIMSTLIIVFESGCAGPPVPDHPQPHGSPVAASLGDEPAPATAERSQADVDKAMRKRGYKAGMYRGERVYCRNETLTGSNLESKVCLTAKQIEDLERSGQDILNGSRQAGCAQTKSGCN